MNDDMINELFKRILSRETENFKILVEIKELNRKAVVNLIRLNAAVDYLNYISGGKPQIDVKKIEEQLNTQDAYSNELRERFSKLGIEDKTGGVDE